MSENNNWWIDDLDPDYHVEGDIKARDLLHLDSEAPWVAIGDENEFGGRVIYCHPGIARFLQRALRLREGRHPMTGEALDDEPAQAILDAMLPNPKLMYAVLERWTHLARIDGKLTERNPSHPVFKGEADELDETEIRDPEGRLVFVDEDGGCFVRKGNQWVEVEVKFSHTVTPKETSK